MDDEIRKKLAKFTSWFQVVDFENIKTIEDYSLESGVPDEGEAGHCQKCITINRCYFKNEKGKKPEEFDYSNSFVLPMFRGLYHPFCECVKLGNNAPKIDEIQLISLEGKYKNFFDKKIDWFYAWGYKNEDKELFKKSYEKLIKQAYSEGNYYLRIHDKYGFRINLEITINGIKEKLGHFYKVKAGFTIYPDKKLKCNTIVGGRA